MSELQHSIERLLIQLELPSQYQAWHWQSRLAELIHQMISREMLPLFDDLKTGNQITRIQKMEIDLGALPQSVSDRKIKDQLLKNMRKELDMIKTSGPTANVQYLSPEASARELMERFLQTGQFPKGAHQFDPSAALELLIRKEPETLWSLLADLFQTVGNAMIHRLSWQFENKTLVALLQSFSKQKRWRQTSGFLSGCSLLLKDGSVLPEKLWPGLFGIILQYRNIPIEDWYIDLIRQGWSLVKKQDDPHLRKEFLNLLHDRFPRFDRHHLSTKEMPEMLKSVAPQLDGINESGLRPFFCENAGLVLLHPFLRNFFSELNLLNQQQNDFLNIESRERSIHLLYYLSTGKTHPPESELALEKMLCCWPVQSTLRRYLELTPGEKQESGLLLKAVIRHWKALGNSSVAALRETFLQRPGKLIFEENEVRIIIEAKTVDVLIDRLPWTRNMIKFPWMEQLLRIEWN